MRERGVRKEQGEAFLLKTPMNAETRPTHICWIERAAYILVTTQPSRGKGTCSSNLDSKFVNCTDKAPSGRLCRTKTRRALDKVDREKVDMRTVTLDDV